MLEVAAVGDDGVQFYYVGVVQLAKDQGLFLEDLL